MSVYRPSPEGCGKEVKVPSKGRRWLINAVSVGSAVIVGAELLGAIGIMGRPETVAAKAVWLWFIGLPFFLFGIVWLAARAGFAYDVRIQRYEENHPILSRSLWLGASFLVVFAAAGLIILLRQH